MSIIEIIFIIIGIIAAILLLSLAYYKGMLQGFSEMENIYKNASVATKEYMDASDRLDKAQKEMIANLTEQVKLLRGE